MVASGFQMTQKNFHANKKHNTQPVKIKNLSIVPTGMLFLNTITEVDSAFPHENPFTVSPEEEQISKTENVLKY